MADEVVGRGLVEILPDFKKFGKELATSMKTAAAQITNSVKPIEGAFRDSNGKLRAANGAFIKEYENGWKAAFSTVAASMAKVGKGVTVIGLGVAAVSVKMAGDFQAETAVLQTAAGETAKGLQVVRKGILNLATGTGTGIKNLTDGMYTVEKAGYRGAAGLLVLKAAAQGAKEENANLADVTNAMTSVMASYHLKATDSVRVMNAIKTAAGEGKITMEQFSGALSTVIPIASANKISFGEVGGAIATLTQHGTSANEATQELASTIRNLAAPNNVAIQEMAHFGINAQDVALKLGTDKRGLAGTINLLSTTILSKMGPSGKVLLSAFNETKQAGDAANLMLTKMPKSLQPVAKAFLDGKMSLSDWRLTLKGLPVDQANLAAQFATLVNKNRGFSDQLKKGGPASKTYTEALKKMSGGAIGLNTILQLTGENSTGLSTRTAKVSTSFNHASKDVEGWKITQGLFNTQIARAKETLQVLAIEIGTKLIPIIQDVISWMGKHKTIVMDLILAFGALLVLMSAMYIAQKLYAIATGISAVVTGTWTLAMKAGRAMALGTRIELAALWLWQKAQAVASGIATAAQWLWNAALSANPIALVVIAIAALVAAIVFIAVKTTWFQTIWRVAWGGIKAAFWATFNFVQDHWRLIVSILGGPVGLAVALISRYWGSIRGVFSGSWNWVREHVFSPMGTFFTHTIPGWAGTMKSKVSGAFDSMQKSIGSLWGKIKNATKTPVNFVINSVWNNGIRAVWSKIGGWIPGLPKLGKIAQLAAGGTIPARPGIFNRPTAIVGEGNPNYPEYVIPTDPKHRTRAAGLLKQAGSQMLSGGGIIGTITGAASGAVSGVGGAITGAAKGLWKGISGATDFLKNPVKNFAKVLNPVLNKLNPMKKSAWGKMVAAMPIAAVTKLEKILGVSSAGLTGGGGGVIPTGQHKAIIDAALSAAHVPPPGAKFIWEAGLNTLIKRESGWNAGAINRTDSNAKAGHPSQGLAQTIPSTFNHYVPSSLRSAGILNPVANVAAAIRYIVSRYGNITKVQQANASKPPKGYDNGGWLPPGLTMAYNGTGKPERIRTAKQEKALSGGGGDTYVFNFSGPVGSQRELENWLVKALDTVGRTKRIPPSWKGA
jgi:SLT domain-containing protein